jgi:hypothetical protein
MTLKKTSDSSSIVELADILTNPIHDDNSKPVTRILRNTYKAVSQELEQYQIRPRRLHQISNCETPNTKDTQQT